MTKTNGVDTVEAGGQTTYTVVVTNHGPDTATGVQVVDSLTDLTCDWTSLATNGATGNTAMGSGDLMEVLLLPNTATVTYTMVCDIDPAATGNLINTVGVVADQIDANAANDSATDMDSVDVALDLALRITANNPIGAGELAVFNLTVTNHGPASGTGAGVTLPLPTGLTFSSSTDCFEATGDVICPLSTPPPGEQATVSYTALVDGGLPVGTMITQTGTISLGETDPVSENNTDSFTLTVVEADIFADGFESGDTSAWTSTMP